MKFDALEQQRRLNEAYQFIKTKIDNQPKILFILGSGLSEFASDSIQGQNIAFEDVPYMSRTTVAGHKGVMTIGNLNGLDVMVLRGRFHKYEGYDADQLVFPIRLAKLLGCQYAIITNAAGGINPDFSPGSLVEITDHINLTGYNVLEGPNLEKLGPRFPDMSYAYDPELRSILKKTAEQNSVSLQSGVYCGVLGPCYETPAEIKMMSILGADMVGMSTVQEVIAANHCEMKVCGISCITNSAAGLSKEKLNHEEVKDCAEKMVEEFSLLLKKFTQNLKSIIS